MSATFLNIQLPWSASILDDKRFHTILAIAGGIVLMMGLIISITDVPELTRAEKEKLPPQLARVILEKKELPPPKPVEPPKEEKKPEEKKPEEKKPEPKKEEPKPEPKPEPVKPPKEAIEKAREQVAKTELAQFRDELAEMREMMPTVQLETASTTQAIGAGQAVQVDRSVINSGAKTASGGINSANLSRDVGGSKLSSRENTKVTSTLAEATTQKAPAATAGNSDGQGGAARDPREISRVMDQHKGAIYQIYHRALRQNATLQGKMVVKIVIDPNGKIVEASVVSSELGDKELETAILRRIRMISFPASNVTRTTVNQTFDFLPQ